MNKKNIFSGLVFVVTALLAVFYLVGPEITNNRDTDKFALGLDLVGGSQLLYEADVSQIGPEDEAGVLTSLKNTLEKRLNPFGTGESSVSIEKSSIFSESGENIKRLVVEIPGVSDPEEAKNQIGKIPLLEFKILAENGIDYESTEMSGRYIEGASLSYGHSSVGPVVAINFTGEGDDIFGKLTAENIGEIMAIFLDGEIISQPRINQAIYGGSAVIEGVFTTEEAKTLAANLNFGALPVPIELVSTNTISPALGKDILNLGLKAALIGLILVFTFMIYFYRTAGVIATFALSVYIVLTLSLFKLFGFVFTAAGIAGFIISIGMAVDANVLIFERIREELRGSKEIKDSVKDGFSRAWLSIRDGNLSSIFTAIILFYMTTSSVQGFALSFGFGVVISMLTAVTFTRFVLEGVSRDSPNTLKRKRFLFGKINLK